MLEGAGLTRIVALVAALAAAALAALALTGAVSSAMAQGTPPICQEYPNLPQCTGPSDDGGSNNPDDPAAGGADGAAGPTANADAGDLPFTGYPVTALVLVLLALLLTGLAIRGYVAVRGRIGSASHS